MSSTEYSVEPAKSGRSTCKVCKAKIDQGILRIGTSTDGAGDYMMTSWRHLECQKRPKALADLSQLAGFAALTTEQQAAVEAWFNSAGTDGKKRSASDANLDSGTVDSGALPFLADINIEKMKAAERKAALAAYSLSGGDKKDEGVRLLKDVAARQAAERRFGALTIAALKDACRLNGQLVGGTKPELVDRCVDGFCYGTLPRCPDCGGGVLKVRYPSKYGHDGQGTFYCKGFYDGT